MIGYVKGTTVNSDYFRDILSRCNLTCLSDWNVLARRSKMIIGYAKDTTVHSDYFLGIFFI